MKLKILFCFLFLLLAAIGCREKYVSPIRPLPTGYLVVEGFINSGTGPSHITLSRTTQTVDQPIVYETGATVSIEGDDNSVNVLAEKTNGVYASDQLNLNNNHQYRLRIKTSSGAEYLSDFVAVHISPQIDSVSWQRQNAGIQIYVSTHDNQQNTRYYQWDFEETWQIHSPYVSLFKFESVGKPPPNNSIITVLSAPDPAEIDCWQTDSSSQLLIASSAKLTNDVIYAMPVAFIDSGSIKMSVKYSILVRQYSITEDAYNFLKKMKKNTEQTGSIFDPQPSELKGNIHSTTNPNEQVIGFLSISSVSQQRIFIDAAQVPDWRYKSPCHEDTLCNDSVNRKGAYGSDRVITRVCRFSSMPGGCMTGGDDGSGINQFFVTASECVDCRLRGTNVKPAFWP